MNAQSKHRFGLEETAPGNNLLLKEAVSTYWIQQKESMRIHREKRRKGEREERRRGREGEKKGEWEKRREKGRKGKREGRRREEREGALPLCSKWLGIQLVGSSGLCQ